VQARIGDTRYGPANPSGGSSTAPSLAPAVKNAAFLARQAFAEHLAQVLGVEPGELAFRDGKVVDLTDESRSMEWTAACGTLPSEGLQQRGGYVEGLAGEGVHGAQAARVRVDLMTGHVQVLKMVCIQDVGLPLNTLALRSQINGGMIGALSYALLEERVIDPDLGLMLNANLEDYRIAGTLEMPELVAIVDEDDTRQQVIGMGEPPAIPGAGVIANAVHNACGARVRDLPLTPDRVLAALGRLS
jgi:xanthine dehydrogenase YagR molybdenum-binding subunit